MNEWKDRTIEPIKKGIGIFPEVRNLPSATPLHSIPCNETIIHTIHTNTKQEAEGKNRRKEKNKTKTNKQLQ